MKLKTILTVLAAISVPAAINLYLAHCTVHSLKSHGAAMANVDFYGNLFIFGPFAFLFSVAGFLLSAHAEEENQRACRLGFAINAGIPFVLYGVFKVLW